MDTHTLELIIDILLPFSIIIMIELFIKLEYIKEGKKNIEYIILGMFLYLISFLILIGVYYPNIFLNMYLDVNLLILFVFMNFTGRCLIKTY